MNGKYDDYLDTFNFHCAVKLWLPYSNILSDPQMRVFCKAQPRQKEIDENSKWGKEIIVTKSTNPKTKAQVPR
jgi:hypothetical protein